MKNENEQIKFWAGAFGDEYTERNNFNLNELYLQNYGITRTIMNQEFLGDLDHKIKILEVGCNRGLQLQELKSGGFEDLWAVEVIESAHAIAKKDFPNVVLSSGFDLPFKDNFFDLTFTSGVLIHIAPENLPLIFSEIYRTSKRYIWGFEYYSEEPTSLNYRGNQNKMWKRNFCQAFQQQFPDLKLVKEKKFKYLSDDNVDQMYLLEKV